MLSQLTRPALLLSLTSLFIATGCGLFDDDPLPPVNYSDGFFTNFDSAVKSARAQETSAAEASRFRFLFADALDEGPGEDELACSGPTWEKVSTFLEIGLHTADVLDGVSDAEPNRVAMYEAAADVILRSDVAAVEDYNERVREMGRSEAQLASTGNLTWASLDLVLTLSEQTVVQRWIESEEWVEGHHERREGYYEDVWVPGYTDTYWQEGSCWDEWVGSDCESYWVDDYCWDEYVADGYWESYCAEYDEWGHCVYYDEYWVDEGYYETYCEPGYYEDVCWDVYETVCQEGQWVDYWVEGYWTQGPWIPGETYWVEGYWADTSGYRSVALLDEEAEILAQGVQVLLSRGEEAIGESCHEELDSALVAAASREGEEASETLRSAIMTCLELIE